MITWNARLSWPHLDWRGNRALETFVADRVAPTGLRVRAIDLSAFWDVPCVLGVARSAVAGDAPLGVGAAAAATVERAVEKALDEADPRPDVGARAAAPRHAAAATTSATSTITSASTRSRRTRGARTSSTRLRRRGRRRPSRRCPGGSPSARVEAICARLARRSASAYTVDVTSPDVRDAGLAVVRVVAPELCALDVEHAARLLGGTRLYEEPRPARHAQATADRGGRQPRPASVPVRPKAAPFVRAELYGDGEPAIDDPAELFHEASKLQPALVHRQAAGLARLAANSDLQTAAARAVRRNPERASHALPPPLPCSLSLSDALDRRVEPARLRGSGLSMSPSSRRSSTPPTACATRLGAPCRREERSIRSRCSSPSATSARWRVVCTVTTAALHALEEQALADPWPALERACPLPDLLAGAACAFLLLAVFGRTRFKYGQRGYRFALLEAGHVAQNVVLAAAALGVAALPLGGYYDAQVDARRRRRRRRGVRRLRPRPRRGRMRRRGTLTSIALLVLLGPVLLRLAPTPPPRGPLAAALAAPLGLGAGLAPLRVPRARASPVPAHAARGARRASSSRSPA